VENITREEAIQIANKILADAEKERLEIAEQEANRGVECGKDPRVPRVQAGCEAH
jgi:hypothetical protein